MPLNLHLKTPTQDDILVGALGGEDDEEGGDDDNLMEEEVDRSLHIKVSILDRKHKS